jgi:hypothetical protein
MDIVNKILNNPVPIAYTIGFILMGIFGLRDMYKDSKKTKDNDDYSPESDYYYK